MEKKLKIIMDMDIGDDIDDAIALLAAMKQGFELIGITTVFRNTPERARQAKKLLKDFGNGYENVPVYAGHGIPMDHNAASGDAYRQSTDALSILTPADYGHIPHYSPIMEDAAYTPDGTDPDQATDFIINACRAYQKNLAVIAIGPFTNLARVIEKDPDALNLAAKVVIMGGAYYKQYADWNVMCDVTAADRLFSSLNHLECIGADVTHRMIGSSSLYDAIVAYAGTHPAQCYLRELCALWKADRPQAKLILHDPLVVYYVADPTLCEMLPVSVAVITDGYAKGLTLNVDAYSKKWMNRAPYENFDESRKVLTALTADRETFLSRMCADFSAR